MTIKKLSFRVDIVTLALAMVLGVLILFASPTKAVSKTDWQAGNIISDNAFTDKDSMSVADIQSFLDKRIACDRWGRGVASEFGSSLTRADLAKKRGWQSPPYTCLNEYHEVPKTSPGGGVPLNNYANPHQIPSGAKSAAWIIKDAAERYRISPKVLLVKLATESAGPLTSDKWPFRNQYRYAMGSHCPDTGAGGTANCNPDYAGFSIQIYSAAKLLRWYMDNIDKPWWYHKKTGKNHVLWNVKESGCGGADIVIENKATAALYTYTPYQPNGAALSNMYGTGDRCSSYGNRNFWRVYWDWFGPSRYIIRGGILEQYTAFGGGERLGSPLMNELCGLHQGACFQDFQYGSIYWTPAANRAYTVIGGIRTKWNSLGKEWGWLGYPMSDEQYTRNLVTQRFQGGEIHYSPSGAIAVHHQFTKIPRQDAGAPRHDTYCGIKDGGCYQQFIRATAYWSPKTNTHLVGGEILNKWEKTNKEWGLLGYPISSEYQSKYGVTQKFQYGTIHIGKGETFYVLSRLGYLPRRVWVGEPVTDTVCGIKDGGCFQKFTKTHLYYSPGNGSHMVFGGIYEKWSSLGKEWGPLGYPVSEEYIENNITIQRFQGGRIVYTSTQGARAELRTSPE